MKMYVPTNTKLTKQMAARIAHSVMDPLHGIRIADFARRLHVSYSCNNSASELL